jgi:hypothetical protein
VSGLKDKLRNAFAVDPEGPAEPTAEQAVPVDWVCRQIAKRHLTTPGLIALEMSKPLNFIASQTMHFFSPAVWAVAHSKAHDQYQHFADFLEQRGSMDYIARRVEHFEAEYERAAAKAAGRETDGDERDGTTSPDGGSPQDS